MKKIIIFLLFFIITMPGFAQEEVKKADLAGSWYPASPEKLSKMFESYLNDAQPKNLPSNIVAVIVPHAGYVYSGPIAAYAFKAVSGMDVDTVIIVGFSHRKYYDAISVHDRGAFETPLGPLPVDRNLAKKLILSHDKLYFNPKAFEDENSVEMMLPFVRYIFKDKEIKIVPIAVGVQSYDNAKILGDALYEALKDREKFLIVASTDMSHFHNYGEANAIDGLAIETLKKMDPKTFLDKISFKKCEACGAGTIAATMIAAKKLGADNIEILKYANSGDTAGMKDRVVGYLSAALYKSGGKKDAENVKKEESAMLNEEQKEKLLRIARETMETYIKTKKKLDLQEDDPTLNREMGAFVTIHKEGRLRGCIGNIVGKGPLYLTVRDMAIESSTGDPRFSSVAPSELDNIDIEVSVLSVPEKVTDPSQIVMGKHGVIVRKGFRSGVYLPQVATETGWSREQFMSSLCAQKAGLPPDAWKTGDADIFIFTAQVFAEKK
jgi:AmmeMemoRadiSam system protein B/AmmeMemoRadiSam system protein A